MKARFLLIAASLSYAAFMGFGGAQAQDAKPFTVAINADPDVLDMTESVDPPTGLATLSNMYENLVATSPDGRELLPALATSWDIEEGGKTITYHLRKGVKFHSGDDFTAKDVLFSHEREMAKAPFYGRNRRFIDKVEALDDETVRFTYKVPSSLALPLHELIIVSKAYHDRVGEEAFTHKPVGTGPYKFIAYAPGQYLDFTAFENYWGKPPAIKKARFVFVKEDATRVAKLKTGEVDMVMDAPYSEVANLQAAGFRLVRLPVHPTVSIQMKLSNPKSPWADLRVRQAIAHAIDSEAIRKGLLFGVPDRYARLAPDELGYDPSLKIPDYDPALAKKLLAEAGYPNGFKTPLYYWAGTYYGISETTSAVTLYLKSVGIETDVKGMEGAQLLSVIRSTATDPNGQYIGVAGLPIANLADPVEAFDLYFYGGPDKNRPVLWRNDDLDQIILKADAAFDPAQRAVYLKEGMKLINDQLVTIPLWNYVDVYAMKAAYDYTPSHHGLAVVLLKQVTPAEKQSAR